MKYKTGAAFFEERSPEDVERFVDKNLEISAQVSHLLEERGWTQKDLARAVGKVESEISRWLSGTHNLTMRSIARMEAALGADIILTPLQMEKEVKDVQYIYLTTTVYETVVEMEEPIPFTPNTIETEIPGPTEQEAA